MGDMFSILCSPIHMHHVTEPYKEAMEKKLLLSLFYRLEK